MNKLSWADLRSSGRCPENSTAPAIQLRGGNAGRRRLHCGRLYSGEAAVVGGNNLFGSFPPAGGWLPGGTVSSDGTSSHRKTALRPVAQLWGTNVGRRRMYCGQLCSGEATVVGNDCLLGSSPPAKGILPGGTVSSDGASSHRKTALLQVSQLRGTNVGRRRLHCGRRNSGEAAVVGGNRLFGCFPPARGWLPGGGCQLR